MTYVQYTTPDTLTAACMQLKEKTPLSHPIGKDILGEIGTAQLEVVSSI